MNKTKVAVYGSLRQGMGNHRLLSHIPDYKHGITTELFDMYSLGGFPAIVPDEWGIPIHVELYDVDDHTFGRLDMLEGYPDFYDRKQIDISTDDGKLERAWIYFMNTPPSYQADTVSSGDWVKYKSV